MPPRSNPTARQERLGSELKKLRQRAGLTAREAAELLGVDQAKISHLEAGRAQVSEERIRRLASHCASDDTDLIDALVAMATERVRGWWEKYRGTLPSGFLDLAEAEYHASAVRTIKITDIPGIMQTEAHARGVFHYIVPALTSEELEARVTHRMQRRTALLDGDSPPDVKAVLHEAALRMMVGGATTTREQLTFLLELSERPGIEIRIVRPAGGFAGTGWSMLHLLGPVPQLDSIHLDTPMSGIFLDAEAQLNKYRTLFSKARKASLGPQQSRDLIHRILKTV